MLTLTYLTSSNLLLMHLNIDVVFVLFLPLCVCVCVCVFGFFLLLNSLLKSAIKTTRYVEP